MSTETGSRSAGVLPAARPRVRRVRALLRWFALCGLITVVLPNLPALRLGIVYGSEPNWGGIPPPAFGGHGADAARPEALLAPPLPDLPGVVPWSLLAAVEVRSQRDRATAVFPATVSRLHRQEVKVQGFMMPLDPGERQRRFLLTVTPQTCAFCLPAGPEGIIEVHARRPVTVSFEPMVLAGRFEVLRDDPTGIFYRLRDAELVRR